MRTVGEFIGRSATTEGATYRWRTLNGSTATVHVRLSPNSQTLVAGLPEPEVERVVHGIARFMAQSSDALDARVCLALHYDDRSGGESVFGQLLEKLMSEQVLSRARLREIVAAHPELKPIEASFAAIWFDRDGDYL
jgi:hypothetical protein